MWNEETSVCESYDPPPTCEEKVEIHISRETEIQERYWLQQTIMTEQNERHIRQLERMHRLNLRKVRQDARLERQNNHTITLMSRETTLIEKLSLVDLRRINLNTAWEIHQQEVEITMDILRRELEMVIKRESTITTQEITVVETVRILAEDLGVCSMPEEA